MSLPLSDFVFQTPEEGQKALDLLHKVYVASAEVQTGEPISHYVTNLGYVIMELEKFVTSRSTAAKSTNENLIREKLREALRLLGE